MASSAEHTILAQPAPNASGSKLDQSNLIQVFLISAAFFLFLTAAAKLISSFGHAQLLNQADPLFRMSYRHLFWLVGGIELIVGGTCIFGKKVWLQAGLVAYLATNFVIYRIAVNHLGIQYCPCLGYLAESLPMSRNATDLILKCILGYLSIGSFGTLLMCWIQWRKGTIRSGVLAGVPCASSPSTKNPSV